MIRALGAALVAFGALWAGWRAVEELRGRVRAAEAVIDGLELLEQELWERRTALPELLEDLSSRTREPGQRAVFPVRPGLPGVGPGSLWRQLAAADGGAGGAEPGGPGCAAPPGRGAGPL